MTAEEKAKLAEFVAGLTIDERLALANILNVDVVRCGECKHRMKRHNCQGRHMDFFCADGERKDV